MTTKRKPRALTIGIFKLVYLEASILLSGCQLTIKEARSLGERLIAMADWIELYGSKDDE